MRCSELRCEFKVPGDDGGTFCHFSTEFEKVSGVCGYRTSMLRLRLTGKKEKTACIEQRNSVNKEQIEE